MPHELNAKTLSNLPSTVQGLKYDRSKVTAGIVHIGVGNFHRMHQEVIVNRVLALPNQEHWGVIGAGLGNSNSSKQKAKDLKDQDGLYTATEFSSDGSQTTEVIGSLLDYLLVPDEPEKFLDVLASPNIRIVGLTITEGGYNIDEDSGEFKLDTPDVAEELKTNKPRTVFGYIVEALDRRRKAGVAPFTVASCDNLRGNGDTARTAFVGFAKAKDASLAEWIDKNVTFPNSMVDRIVPSVGSKQLEHLNSLSGINDKQPVYGETFLQWVVEDKFCNGRPELGEVGVQLRNDVPLFETMKGRVLNATHSVLAYPAILSGIELVYEAMDNKPIYDFVTRFVNEDTLPILEGPPGVDKKEYTQAVLDRFSNRAVADQMLRIGHYGSAKIPVFHRKTIETLLKDNGHIDREAFFLACFARYLEGVDDNGKKFEVVEPALSKKDWEELKSDDSLGVLRTSPLAPLKLDKNERFVEAFTLASKTIAEVGVQRALKEKNDGRW